MGVRCIMKRKGRVWANASRHRSVLRKHRRPDSEQATELPPAFLAAVAQEPFKRNGMCRPETRGSKVPERSLMEMACAPYTTTCPILVAPTSPTGLGLSINRRTLRFGSRSKAWCLKDALWHISAAIRSPAPPMEPEAGQSVRRKDSS